MAASSRGMAILCFLAIIYHISLVNAHGHDDDEHHDGSKGMSGMDHNVSVSVPEQSDNADTYWRLTTARWWIYGHIILMLIDWVLILPISIIFAVAKSNLHIPVQVLFLLINGIAIFLSVIYNAQTPDLYPSNAHHRMGWVAVAILVAQTLVGVIFSVAKSKDEPKVGKQEYSSLINPLSYQRTRIGQRQSSLNSDSGHGGSGRTSSSLDDTRVPLAGHEQPYFDHSDGEDEVEEETANASPATGIFDRLARKYIPTFTISKRKIAAANVGYQISHRLLLIWAFMLLSTGISTYTGVFKGRTIFNGLAHVIKGGIFFFYGVFTLGRYLGSFADLGWAWNIKPDASVVGRFRAGIKSAEMVESALVFTYGFTNVWLEHLGSWGGEWHTSDLEHVSIAFWFLGGGLMGILVESKRIRDLLNNTFIEEAMISINQQEMAPTEANMFRGTPKNTQNMNVFPALVIFMLGVLMGSHHQETMLGSMLHKQWGFLLSGCAVSRLGTFLILYLKPPTSHHPSRPFTEPLAAFCLMAGGTVLMMSNSETVNAFNDMHIDGMFAFTLAIGTTALLMSYETLVIAMKGWAVKREAVRHPKPIFTVA